MFRDKIPARQLSAWLFTAIVPPLIQLSGGSSWVWLLAVGALCLLLDWTRSRWGCAEMPKWSLVPGYALVLIAMGELSALSAGSWPVGDSFPAVPLILLALAAWSASKGPQAAARTGAVLFWFLIIMYLFVFAAGAKQIRWEWLRPVDTFPQPMCLVLLLIPSAAECLAQQGKRGGKLMLGLVVAVAAALLTQGVLSPEAAGASFYEMTRSLELLGVAQRFEALTCVAATVGWFGLLTLLLSVCGELFYRIRPGWKKVGVWLAAITAAGWLLCGLHISGWILAGAWAVFWAVLPISTQGIGKIKKS